MILPNKASWVDLIRVQSINVLANTSQERQYLPVALWLAGPQPYELSQRLGPVNLSTFIPLQDRYSGSINLGRMTGSQNSFAATLVRLHLCLQSQRIS